MQLPRRVVVTGMGLISPLGNSVNESWSNCIKGCSGISENVVDLEDIPIKIQIATKIKKKAAIYPENL